MRRRPVSKHGWKRSDWKVWSNFERSFFYADESQHEERHQLGHEVASQNPGLLYLVNLRLRIYQMIHLQHGMVRKSHERGNHGQDPHH